MLASNKPSVSVTPVLQLGVDDMQEDTTVPQGYSHRDMKLAKLEDDLCAELVAYAGRYPCFKQCIFTSKCIAKLTCKLEALCHTHGIDKKALVLRVVGMVAGRSLTRTERAMLDDTIQFLHDSRLIRANPLVKLYHYLRRIFR